MDEPVDWMAEDNPTAAASSRNISCSRSAIAVASTYLKNALDNKAASSSSGSYAGSSEVQVPDVRCDSTLPAVPETMADELDEDGKGDDVDMPMEKCRQLATAHLTGHRFR